ncbi:uncharacterized protein [Miscanthus floridulus]|uniref:uncharacterized protein n=1 Tax=Miscanthus floridulus TaxID=154761 RepID=UPI003458BB5A
MVDTKQCVSFDKQQLRHSVRLSTCSPSTIANGAGHAVSPLGQTTPRARINSPSIRSGYGERTHQAQRRRSNPSRTHGRLVPRRDVSKSATAAAATGDSAAAVATSTGGSSPAAAIATGDSATAALRPGAVGPFAGDEHPQGQYAAVVPHLHRERAGILFSFSSEAPPPAATVPSSSRADEPAAVAMESTPGGTTTTTILRRKKVSSSSAKRKQSGVKQRKEQPAKRFKSPAGPMSPLIPARSTGIRMMLRVSPRLMSPSTTLANSSPQPPTSALEKKRNNLGHGSPHRIKRRKLTSEIWEDFEAIDDGETVAEAWCLHCHKLFKASATNGIAAAATNAACVRG